MDMKKGIAKKIKKQKKRSCKTEKREEMDIQTWQGSVEKHKNTEKIKEGVGKQDDEDKNRYNVETNETKNRKEGEARNVKVCIIKQKNVRNEKKTVERKDLANKTKDNNKKKVKREG